MQGGNGGSPPTAIPVLYKQDDHWTFLDATCKIGEWIAAGILSPDSALMYDPPLHSGKYEEARNRALSAVKAPVKAADVADYHLKGWYGREDSLIYRGLLLRPTVHALKSIKVDGESMEKYLKRIGVIRLPIAVRRSRKVLTCGRPLSDFCLRQRLFDAIKRVPGQPRRWPSGEGSTLEDAVVAAVVSA